VQCNVHETVCRLRQTIFLPFLGGWILSRHFPAFLRTSVAGFGAFLAVVVIMLLANVATALANFCAQLTNGFCKFAIACHGSGCQSAKLRAIDIRTNTIRHFFRVRLAQAGSGTVIAGCGAFITGFNTTGIKII
jgi:hypothetical protein